MTSLRNRLRVLRAISSLKPPSTSLSFLNDTVFKDSVTHKSSYVKKNRFLPYAFAGFE